MSTFVDMQNRIADEVDDPNLLAPIKNSINSAIQYYKGKRFYFNQRVATFSTVAGQEYYDATDLADIPLLITIDAMTVNLSPGPGSRVPLSPADFGAIDAAQSGSVRGDPSNYAYYQQQIRLYPIPVVVRTITMAFHCQLSPLPLVDDASTNAWLNDGEILIRQCAKRYLAADYIDEPARAQVAGPLETEALWALQLETRKRISNDRLRTELVSRSSYSILNG